MSTGTIATQPSSSIDITTSCRNALPVWSILASTFKQFCNPELISSENLPFSSMRTCLIAIDDTSKARRLYTDVTIDFSTPLEK